MGIRKKIKKGDLVVLPLLQSQRDIAVGIITGDYEYKQYTSQIIHSRKVTWIKTIARSEFDLDLQKSFGSDDCMYHHTKQCRKADPPNDKRNRTETSN